MTYNSTILNDIGKKVINVIKEEIKDNDCENVTETVKNGLKKMIRLLNVESAYNGNDLSDFEKYVYSLDSKSMAGDIFRRRNNSNVLDDVIAVCRRRFCKDEIILYVDLAPDSEDYPSGVVILDNKIVYWENYGENIEEIYYSDIQRVDYDEDEVYIWCNGRKVDIYIESEEHCSRHMYGFIMDILDYKRQNQEYYIED